MAIEKDLKDNTAALNANTEILQKLYDLKAGVAEVSVVTPAMAGITATPAPVVSPVVAAQTPHVTPAPVAAPVLTEAPAPAPVAAPAVALSTEEMNNLLVSEFKRIGDRTPIDAAMNSLGVISVTDLPADKQQSLIAAVAAIPSAA